MIIVKFEDVYGAEFWGEGETVQDAIDSLDALTSDAAEASWDCFTFWEARRVNVERLITYTVSKG